MQDVPYGYCHCGCGEKTPIARHSDAFHGYIAGEPMRFAAPGHRLYVRRPVADRFWEKVDKNGPIMPGMSTPCWVWTAKIGSGGYGRFWLDGKDALAHRVAYRLLVGPIPGGLEIDHVCKNRRCVRHLEAVTSRENTRRSDALSGVNARRTHCVNGHELSGDNLYIHRNGYWRSCRTCTRERMRRYRAEKRLNATS